jgi:hypothetical protein
MHRASCARAKGQENINIMDDLFLKEEAKGSLFLIAFRGVERSAGQRCLKIVYNREQDPFFSITLFKNLKINVRD